MDLEPVISVLCQELLTVGYSHNPIQLSCQIERFFGSEHSDETEGKRIANLMDEGTRLRSESGCGDAVAWLGIAEIRRIRTEELGGRTSRNAFILRSLKHPKEVETLRSVYGKGFFLISVYAPREVRVTALADRIRRSNFGKGKKAPAIAERTVDWRSRGGKPRFFLFQNTYLDIQTAIVSEEIPRLLIALKIIPPEV